MTDPFDTTCGCHAASLSVGEHSLMCSRHGATLAPAYYVERGTGGMWDLYATPGDDGYPSRRVASFTDMTRAGILARVLERAALLANEYTDMREVERIVCR
jgi:hypothetical protein